MNHAIKPKLIIDTDPGHDDALAVLMLLKSGRFGIQAVTTVAGNSTIQNVTRNAQAILDLAASAAPVFSGKPQPLKRKLVTAVVHGPDGLAGFDTGKTRFKLTDDAPQRIVEIVRKYPGEVTILALGPLSNIARAFQIDPELPSLIKEVVIMGGAINVPGNKNRVAEFNFFVDPEAADIVFRSGVAKTLLPLDICVTTALDLEDFRKLPDSPLRTALLPMMEHFLAGLRGNETQAGILAYDAIAGYILLNRQAFEFKAMDIIIETMGEYTFGMSVPERRKLKIGKLNVNVAMNLAREKFRQDFFRLLAL
jgi:inosine-uridine nucleoside N-ribohydrolase